MCVVGRQQEHDNPNLEYRAFVECFVSLQFLNPKTVIGPLGPGISPSQGRIPKQTQDKHRDTSMP
jgi:hypothetical protein